MLYPKIDIKVKKNNKKARRMMLNIKKMMFTSISVVQCIQYFFTFIEKTFHF